MRVVDSLQNFKVSIGVKVRAVLQFGEEGGKEN